MEIATPRGFAYGQYVGEHRAAPAFGSLIRVFPGLHEASLGQRAGSMAAQGDLLIGFYPLSVWLSRGVATNVLKDSDVGVPERNYVFKLGDDGTGTRWALWDAQRGERFVGALTATELTDYPTLVIYDELALIVEILARSGFDEFDATEDWYRARWSAAQPN